MARMSGTGVLPCEFHRADNRPVRQCLRGVVLVLGSRRNRSPQRLKCSLGVRRQFRFWQRLCWCHCITPLVACWRRCQHQHIIIQHLLKIIKVMYNFQKGSIDLSTLVEYTNSRHTKDSSCTRIEGVEFISGRKPNT